MTHEKFKIDLAAHHDGELSPMENARVETHVAACAECRKELESLKKTSAFFPPPTEARDADDFVRRVMARVDETQQPLFFSGWKPAALPAALALATALFFILFRPVDNPAEPAGFDGIAYLAGAHSEPLEIADAGVGTAIEDYFL